ncbi:MAG: hypothetical protein QME45_02500 [Clostridiales bacterium]|nr:hypothetical protein [Clostridiales bacterium]HBM81485.1 hypothetical protein [Clostridiaceae bacterium]
MEYILLSAGIILVVVGINGCRNSKKNRTDKSKRDSKFQDYLSQDVIAERLDEIDEKIDTLISGIEPYLEQENKEVNTKVMDNDDINEKITELKNNGASIEEIAEKLNITKGEVLLRLGIKR